MENLVKVIVQNTFRDQKGKKSLINYICYYDNGWMCGCCMKANLDYPPHKGDKCPNCKAKVIEVIEDSPELHRKIRTCAMCSQELREDEKLEDHYKLSCTRSIVPSFETRLQEIETMLGLR